MVPFTPTRKAPAPRWHHVRLEAQQLAEREHERMKMRFNRIYMAARTPRGMTLWMTPDGDSADVYLSPQAQLIANELIRRYQARPCDAPVQPTVLIAGDGYDAQHLDTRVTSTPNIRTTRRYLPVPYSCRSVRTFVRTPQKPPRFTRDQLAPFVRRYADAWALFPPPR